MFKLSFHCFFFWAGGTGNKGGVAVSFFFNGTSFGFVNCHLTSGSDKVLRFRKQKCFWASWIPLCCFCRWLFFCTITPRRNQNFVDILRLLSLGDKQLSALDISLRFTHLFWFGDLNYRLDLDVQVSWPNHFLNLSKCNLSMRMRWNATFQTWWEVNLTTNINTLVQKKNKTDIEHRRMNSQINFL